MTAPPTMPEPPALAYPIVESMLGPGYFLRPHPSHGIELVIVGADDKPTTWAMHPHTAAQVAVLVVAHPGLRLVSERPYSPPAIPQHPGDIPQ